MLRDTNIFLLFHKSVILGHFSERQLLFVLSIACKIGWPSCMQIFRERTINGSTMLMYVGVVLIFFILVYMQKITTAETLPIAANHVLASKQLRKDNLHQ